jgi:predicted nucleic acid-binding protein
VSSLLARVETARALWRTDPPALANLPLVLGAVHLIAIDESLCAAAAGHQDPGMRSLDAIHLATAVIVGSALTSFVTYDKRMITAAAAAGLPTASPC